MIIITIPEHLKISSLMLILISCGKILVALAWLAVKDTKIKAYAQKCTLQHIQINLWTVFLEENSIGDCYFGYIFDAKPPKLALLNQVKSWSKPTPKLNHTKPRQEFLTIIQTFKHQTGTFTLLWPVFPAGEHCSPQPCSSYSLDQAIFWNILWCPVLYMYESFKSGLKRRWKKHEPHLTRFWIQPESVLGFAPEVQSVEKA